MSNVYAQHRTAFAAVSAYVILRNGERVATVAIKHGNAVTAYVHWIGVEMQKGRANGGGYDRASAACAAAAVKIPDNITGRGGDGVDRTAFIDSLAEDDGRDWTRRLTDAGFSVIQAV